MSLIPEHFRIHTPIVYDRSVDKSEIVEVFPANGLNQANINSPNAQLRFTFNSQNRFFHLSSKRSGFRVRVGFITKTGANNDRNAKCTLVSNWFGHMFSSAKLNLSGNKETVDNLGPAMDIDYQRKGKEFRLSKGELEGFIPDTSNGDATYAPTGKTPTFVAAAIGDTAGIVATLSNKTLIINDYNTGFERRLKLYNYTVDGNDVVRYAECFVPLSSIFGFFREYDKLMYYLNFEIELIRQTINERVYFGAANTSISFGNPDTTGLLYIALELESVTPNPELSVALINEFKEPIHITYLEKTCLNKVVGQAQTFDLTETRFRSPRYVFIGCMKNNRNLYRHSDIGYIQVVVDSETYPNLQQDAKFLENRYTKFYQSFSDIAEYFDDGTALSMKEYRELYTIFGIDLSQQKEKIRGMHSNLSLRIHRNAIPANDDNPSNPQSTEYFILFLSERHIKYNALTGTVEDILV